MKNLRGHLLICLALAAEASSFQSDLRQANESSGRIRNFHFLFLCSSLFDVRFTNSTSKFVSETASRGLVLGTSVAEEWGLHKDCYILYILWKLSKSLARKNAKNNSRFWREKLRLKIHFWKMAASFLLFECPISLKLDIFRAKRRQLIFKQTLREEGRLNRN